ncbi:MAG: HEAT repeat domain-containing protein [Planctomycetota bacterium]
MNDQTPAIAPATTRLGQLQRGRGAGFLAALAAGAAAHDDLLHCLLADPRRDRQTEQRARYYGELLVAVDLPLEPLLDPLRAAPEGVLGHDVLAASFALGHAPTRELLADENTAEPLVAGITGCLWGERWARAVDLPPRARAHWLRLDLQNADSARSEQRPQAPTPLANLSVDAVLELARGPQPVRRDRLLGELCARGDAATRARLAAVVADDRVLDRVRLAARALGLLADDRLLPLAEDLFAREDVFADPERRLPADLRMRRACLSDYAQHLPGPMALPLARAWHERGAYFTTVAGKLFELHATAADRRRLEAYVAANIDDEVGAELDALGRLGDPASIPLLVEVAATTPASRARTRAVRALSFVVQHPLAQATLREALWDAEDEAAELACGTVAGDDEVRRRIAALAANPLADAELTARALARSARW